MPRQKPVAQVFGVRALALPQDRILVWLVLGTSNHDGRRKSPTESVSRICMFFTLLMITLKKKEQQRHPEEHY